MTHVSQHERHLSRRAALRLGAAGMAALASQGLAPLAARATAPAATKKVSVTFWTPGGSSLMCRTHTVIEHNFEKLHPTIHMNGVLCGTGNQDFLTVLLAHITAGNPPDVTILYDPPASLAVQGALTALDPLMATAPHAQAKNWPAAVLASCQYGGKTYGLPVTAGTYGIFYNADWFARKGIATSRDAFPKTWNELRKLSKEFTHWKGDTLQTAGFFPWPGAYTGTTMAIWSALNGGQFYDAAKRTYTIDDERNVEMMSYLLAWLKEEYKGDLQAVTRSGSWFGYPGTNNQPPAFQAGRLAMTEEGSWLMGDFYASITPTFRDWNVAIYPFGPSGHKATTGYYPNWMVLPKGAAHVKEAFAYMDYVSGVGVRTWFANVPDIPANTTVPATLVPTIVVQHRGRAFAEDIMHFYHQALQQATPMFRSPIYSFEADQINKAVQQIFYKTATPKQALADAQRACQGQLVRTVNSAA